MLGKLLKYDLKWLYKTLRIFYIIAIIFAFMARVLNEVENSLILNIIGKVCNGVVISMIINIIINNFMGVWARFRRNLYKDESYLTHTLPVEKNKIYLSKVLAAIITLFTSFLVILLCLYICYYSKETLEWIKTSLELVANTYDSTVHAFLGIAFIVIVLEAIFALLAGVLGIIIGYKSNNLKVVKSIVYGFVIYMITSMLSLVVMLIIGLFNPDIMNLFNTVNVVDINAIKSVLYIGIILYTAYIFAYYFIGKKLLNKGVDVD